MRLKIHKEGLVYFATSLLITIICLFSWPFHVATAYERLQPFTSSRKVIALACLLANGLLVGALKNESANN